MHITLHEATEQVRALLDQVDPETGELPAELDAAREVVAAKSLAVVAYILDSEAACDAADERIKAMQAKVKSGRRRAEWLRQYLKAHMAASGITELDGAGIKAKLYRERDNRVDVFEPALLPSDYLREVPAKFEPDKKLIERAINDGHDVPGARIVASDRLSLSE